ncbi:MAG: AMP-binding protein, partial [Spirochaetales bacterium]|nr:AMP-binding protein [Spirochaetales bacterium]
MSDNKNQVFGDLLDEGREFPPSPEFAKNAIINDQNLYEKAKKDPLAYWEDEARRLHWSKPWDKVMEWDAPHAKWYTGGKINITDNCLDRHLGGARANKAALIWEGENGNVRTLTYRQLHREVSKFANCLKALGVEKGDRIAIYMPMLVEAVVAMLASSRIGAIHNVIFGGFSADSLADRINDSQCKVLITADGGWRRGQVITLKHNADRALETCPSIEHVVIVENLPGEHHLLQFSEGRDHWYHRLMAQQDGNCSPEEMDSEDVLFILYTSGTTGKPKGIVHTTGGYAVGTHTTMSYVFDLKDEDVFWCTADVGWVTGHSYIVYGPLMCGATILMYEGAPNHPDKDRFWQMIDDHQVSIFYTAPTAIRAFMKWGDEYVDKHNLSSLRVLGSVGEPINPEAWMWYHKKIGKEKCPIVDT